MRKTKFFIKKTIWSLTEQIQNKKFKKEGKILYLKEFFYWIRIRTATLDPDKSRPNPQHCPGFQDVDITGREPTTAYQAEIGKQN